MTRKASEEKIDNGIQVRFTDSQLEEIKALCPTKEKLAAFVRRMSLAGARASGPDTLRKAVAFIVGAISTEYTPEQVLPLFDEFLAAETEG